MQRFELAIDGTCKVGKPKDVFVSAVEYGDKDFVAEDETEFTNKANVLLKKNEW